MALLFANNNSLSEISSLPTSISGGGMTLISEQTASSSATISFTSGIDSTYDSYVFKFIDIHPQTDGISFQLNFRDGGSSYDAVKTTTYFRTYHLENDSGFTLSYRSAEDLAQSTGFQTISDANSNDNDHCHAGYLKLFNPSSTTFVKHFMLESNQSFLNDSAHRTFVAGYCNTTSAIDGVQFKMSSGNIDSGVIKLYGIS
jgi:hypothetical protein